MIRFYNPTGLTTIILLLSTAAEISAQLFFGAYKLSKTKLFVNPSLKNIVLRKIARISSLLVEFT